MLIDKSQFIGKDGKKTFNVGNNVGIDTMVQKFLRSKPGFYQHKIVTKDGSYMQYSKTKEVTPEQLYSTLEGEINVKKNSSYFGTVYRNKPGR